MLKKLEIADVACVSENRRKGAGFFMEVIKLVNPAKSRSDSSRDGSPEDQLERVCSWNKYRKWGFLPSDFPTKIPFHVPSIDCQALVLCAFLPEKENVGSVQRTFDEHAIILKSVLKQEGYSFSRFGIKSDSRHLQLVSDKKPMVGLRWMALDLFAGLQFRDEHKIIVEPARNADSAAIEILSFMMHFPNRSLRLIEKGPIGLFGYQYSDGYGWDNILTINPGWLKHQIKMSICEVEYYRPYYKRSSCKECFV